MPKPRPRIRAYFAVSLDGMIADQTGGIGWLAPFEQIDVGFDDFLASITTIAMGRRTYEQIRSFGEWPYEGKDVIVMTSRPIVGGPRGVRTFKGSADALSRQISGGDMWVCGGSMLFNEMFRGGHIDRLELFIIPVVLGDGVPLFAPGTRPTELHIRAVDTHPMGMVELIYDVMR